MRTFLSPKQSATTYGTAGDKAVTFGCPVHSSNPGTVLAQHTFHFPFASLLGIDVHFRVVGGHGKF